VIEINHSFESPEIMEAVLAASPKVLAKHRGITVKQARACQEVLLLALVIRYRRMVGRDSTDLEKKVQMRLKILPRDIRNESIT